MPFGVTVSTGDSKSFSESSNLSGATMEKLKEIINKALSEMQFPIIYGSDKFWEEVDKEILKQIKNGNCI